MATKLKKFRENGHKKEALNGFFRHWAVKAAAFVLFVVCCAAFVVTGFRFDSEWYPDYPPYTWEEGRGVKFDYLAGRAYKDSQALHWDAHHQLNTVLDYTGWNETSQERSDRVVRENASYLDGLEGVLYYVRTPYRTITNYNMTPEEYKKLPVWILKSGDENGTSTIYGGFWHSSPPYYQNFDFVNNTSEPIRPRHPHDDYNFDYVNDDEYNQKMREYEAALQKYEKESREYWEDYEAAEKVYYRQYEYRFALTEENVSARAAVYAKYEGVFWKYTVRLIFFGLIALICLLYLCIVAGRKPETSGVHLSFWDKPWLDISLCAIVLIIALSALWLNELWRHKPSEDVFNRVISYLSVAAAVFAAAGLWWLLSAVKRLKARSFLRHTLIYNLLAWIFRPFMRFCRAVINGAPLTVQIGIGVVVYGILVLLFAASGFSSSQGWLFILFLCVIAATVYFVWKAHHLANVAKGIDRLAKGDYQTPVPENGKGVLKTMAQNVNAATGGLKAAVEKELTGQRFKAELITNVSHDLRTPLTSVITYADLLQSEGLSSPDASKYLEIIQSKARRLQVLTEDLFEASKASSGETRALLAPLEIGQLIQQTLGEMGDRLSAAGLEVRVSGGCGQAMADAKLMSRVFENLLRNMEKYALAGTRVYIDMANEQTQCVITLRNISASPLEGQAERLAERFTRGDEARSTEGSGLGLAIVKSFMELQNGSCSISVDGDLFKVTLGLPLA
ncbi:MAG: HAMP domain-containing histidine kinase [Oscillospiraceae bacterium]|nr:HAMP domain-containing histidine kinase [Oscillospiraceae bacterium]